MKYKAFDPTPLVNMREIKVDILVIFSYFVQSLKKFEVHIERIRIIAKSPSTTSSKVPILVSISNPVVTSVNISPTTGNSDINP